MAKKWRSAAFLSRCLASIWQSGTILPDLLFGVVSPCLRGKGVAENAASIEALHFSANQAKFTPSFYDISETNYLSFRGWNHLNFLLALPQNLALRYIVKLYCQFKLRLLAAELTSVHLESLWEILRQKNMR